MGCYKMFINKVAALLVCLVNLGTGVQFSVRLMYYTASKPVLPIYRVHLDNNATN